MLSVWYKYKNFKYHHLFLHMNVYENNCIGKIWIYALQPEIKDLGSQSQIHKYIYKYIIVTSLGK